MCRFLRVEKPLNLDPAAARNTAVMPPFGDNLTFVRSVRAAALAAIICDESMYAVRIEADERAD